MDLSSLLKLASNPQVRNLVMSLIGQMGGKGQGGASMNGLLENLNKSGMGDQVKSWVSTGDNKPITPEQVTQALGADHIAQAAKDAGCTPQQASEDLAKVLPQMVDTATPTGSAPAATDFDQMFSKIFGDAGQTGNSGPQSGNSVPQGGNTGMAAGNDGMQSDNTGNSGGSQSRN
jgi:uncharacterized protein YidB (DUF937 family)